MKKYVKRCAKFNNAGKCVRFKRVRVPDGGPSSSPRRGRHCVMFGRRSDGTRYCKKYSSSTSSSGGLSGLGSSGRRCVRHKRVRTAQGKLVKRCARYA